MPIWLAKVTPRVTRYHAAVRFSGLGLCLVTLVACGQSPIAPSMTNVAPVVPLQIASPELAVAPPISPVVLFSYPPELQPTIDAMDRDPWVHPITHEPVGVYVRQHIGRLHYRADHPDDAYANVIIPERRVELNPRSFPTLSIALQIGLLVHEARHIDLQTGHSCGTGSDRTMEENGAIAVHVVYLEHAGEREAANWYRTFAIGCL